MNSNTDAKTEGGKAEVKGKDKSGGGEKGEKGEREGKPRLSMLEIREADRDLDVETVPWDLSVHLAARAQIA